MSLEPMLKRLKESLKSLKVAQEAQGKMADELIQQLPEEKRAEGIALIRNAKKGKMDINELRQFGKGVRDMDKEEFETLVKKGVDKAEKKKEEVSKEE